MSGFFSLSAAGKDNHNQQPHHHHHHHQTTTDHTTNNNNNNSLFLFKNEEIYTKGFDLWQQYYQLHQQTLLSKHHQNQNNNIHDHHQDVSSNDHSHRSSGGLFRVNNQQLTGMSCQDCGNKAKKECSYMRCRACCKSRGFHCQTHVRSTWVPAAKRRERLQQQKVQGGDHDQNSTKRTCRDNNNSISTGFELGNFPSEVNCTAVFRCVRVSTPTDDPDEHLAYQTAVSIGGHVFKGILYDQGHRSNRYNNGGGGTLDQSLAQHQPLDLIATTSNAYITTNVEASIYNNTSSSTTPLINSFMAGTQFFPPPRP